MESESDVLAELKVHSGLLASILESLRLQMEMMSQGEEETEELAEAPDGPDDACSPGNIRRFIEECLVLDNSRQMPSSAMTTVWRNWARVNGLSVVRRKDQGQGPGGMLAALGAAGLVSTRPGPRGGVRQGRVFLGVGLTRMGKELAQ